MELRALLDAMLAHESLDLHLIAGQAPAVRVDGDMVRLDGPVLEAAAIEEMLTPHLNARERAALEQGADVDRILRFDDRAFTLHLFHERGHLAAAIHVLPAEVPTLDELYDGSATGTLLAELIARPSELIIITGHTGSGKMTTLSAMVETVNRTQARRILAIGSPLDYEFVSKRSLVTQRNIGEDAVSYSDAARSAFRADVSMSS